MNLIYLIDPHSSPIPKVLNEAILKTLPDESVRTRFSELFFEKESIYSMNSLLRAQV